MSRRCAAVYGGQSRTPGKHSSRRSSRHPGRSSRESTAEIASSGHRSFTIARRISLFGRRFPSTSTRSDGFRHQPSSARCIAKRRLKDIPYVDFSGVAFTDSQAKQLTMITGPAPHGASLSFQSLQPFNRAGRIEDQSRCRDNVSAERSAAASSIP